MEQVEQPVHHVRGITLISVSYLFERACYYGVRSLIILYFFHVLQYTKVEAAGLYTLFTAFTYFLPLLGGVVGDFLLGATTTMVVGLSLEALGCFCLAIPTVTTAYLGFFVFLIGSGLFKPNIQQQAGSLFKGKTSYMDAAFATVYFVINLGSMLGPLLIGVMGDNATGYHFSMAFMFAGVFVLLSIVPIGFDFKNLRNSYLLKNKIKATYSASSIIALVAAIFLLPVFWTISGVLDEVSYHAGVDSSSGILPLTFLITIIVSGPISITVWSLVKLESLKKIGVGFLLMAIPLLMLYTAPFSLKSIPYFSGTAEALIAIPVLSVIARFAPPKLMGLFFAISVAMNYLSTKAIPFFMQLFESSRFAFTWTLSALAFFACVLFLVLGFTLSKNDPIQEADQ